ncbi:hypothetical protein, partial [Termitidicoccus mucosus]
LDKDSVVNKLNMKREYELDVEIIKKWHDAIRAGNKENGGVGLHIINCRISIIFWERVYGTTLTHQFNFSYDENKKLIDYNFSDITRVGF